MSSIKLSSKEGNLVVWDDHDDWESVKNTEEIVDQGRWETMYTGVFKHKPTGKFYRLYWNLGSTEQQERNPYEDYDDCEATEVELKEVVVKQWVEV